MEAPCDSCRFVIVSLNRKCHKKLKLRCLDIEDILEFALSAYCNSFYKCSVSVHPDAGERGRLSYLVKICGFDVDIVKFSARLQDFAQNALHDYLTQCDVSPKLLRRLRVTVV